MNLYHSFHDFVVFLYVHMAISDGVIHSSEEQVILKKMGKLFPGEINLKAKYDRAIAEYSSLNPSLTMDMIQESFAFFNHVTFSQKYKVYSDMYDIVNADGKVEDSEKSALEDLKKIIDMNITSQSL